MAKHTKKNLLTWIESNWGTELKLGLIYNILGDEDIYRKKLLYALRNAIESVTVEEMVDLLEAVDIDAGKQLWHVVKRQTNTTSVLINMIIANECGYNTEEDIWKDMDYDLSDEKETSKTRAWYRFWSRSK